MFHAPAADVSMQSDVSLLSTSVAGSNGLMVGATVTFTTCKQNCEAVLVEHSFGRKAHGFKPMKPICPSSQSLMLNQSQSLMKSQNLRQRAVLLVGVSNRSSQHLLHFPFLL